MTAAAEQAQLAKQASAAVGATLDSSHTLGSKHRRQQQQQQQQWARSGIM
jgi:hypothetical protein